MNQPGLRIDVVFTDVEMPGSMDGFGLSKWVRENRPELPVVLAGTVERAVAAASELCGSGPLPKPYEPKSVADRIKRLMRARGRRKGCPPDDATRMLKRA
jgi:DNA-binding NtrC family response regulator